MLVAGFVTRDQQFKAEDLHRTLADQTVYLNLMWRSEADSDKFCNTREWVQIIAEETAIKLAAIQKIISLPGTIPRHHQMETHQMETHGQRTLPPPGSFPRQRQTETFGNRSSGDLTADTVRQTTVYENGQEHVANQQYSLPAKRGPLHSTRITRDPTLENDRIAWNSVGQGPRPDTRKVT